MMRRFVAVAILLALAVTAAQAKLFFLSRGTQGPLPPLAIVSAAIDCGSNCSYTSGAASGTVIGNLSATMSIGSFTGTWSTSGTDGTKFSAVGSQLQTNGTTPTCTSTTAYSLNIVATQGGAGGSPKSQAITVTCNPAAVGIACDIGPNYTGSVPPAAQAAGFTHCVANYDFTQTGSFSAFGHSGYTWANMAGWLDICGASTPVMYAFSYGGPSTEPPCSDYNIVTDNNGDPGQSNGKVLQVTYTPADNSSPNGQTMLNTVSQNGNPTPAGLYLKQGFYDEQTMRLTVATVNSSCQSWNVGCLTYDFWTYAIGGSCPGCNGTGGAEFDFVEMFTNGNWYSTGGTSNLGSFSNYPVGNATGQSSYHTYGALTTVLNTNSGSNVENCVVVDNVSASRCVSGNLDQTTYITNPNMQVYVAEIGPQRNGNNCGPSNNQSCAPTQNQNALIQKTTLWACPGANESTPCYTNSLVTY